MLLSKACIYGIRAAIYLAVQKDRRFVPIKEISESMGISFHFLTKILQGLSLAGIIESEKGPKGGVSLKEPKNRITVLKIIDAIDGNEVFENCILNLPGCTDENPCSLHKIWKTAKQELKVRLHNSSLLDLANDIETGDIRLFDAGNEFLKVNN